MFRLDLNNWLGGIEVAPRVRIKDIINTCLSSGKSVGCCHEDASEEGGVWREGMQLTSYTDYGLRVLLYLMSQPERRATTREIAEAYGISLNHLTKVTKDLTKAGWLIGTRGVGGGVRLAAHAPDLRLGEIVRRTENFELLECFDLKTNTCSIAKCCELRGVLYRARKAFFDVLDGTTLRDVAGNADVLRAHFGGIHGSTGAALG